MQEIASHVCVEDDALIEHIIDGIQDDEINKTMLYGAQTLHEIRKQLELYDKRKEKMRENKRPTGKKEIEKKKDNYTKSGKVHSKGCESPDHSFKNCTTKEKDLKCFNCNNFGHIAPDCPEEKKPQRKAAEVNCIKSVDEKFLKVNINNRNCRALLDTGSDVSVMRRDAHEKVGRPKLQKTTRLFTGFGNAMTKPLGAFATDIVVGNDRFPTDIFVVPSASMQAEVILSHDFLTNMEVVIRGGRIDRKSVV